MEKSKRTRDWKVWKKWDKPKKIRVIIFTVVAFILLLAVAPIVVYYNIESAASPSSVNNTDSTFAADTTEPNAEPLPYVLNSKVGGREFVGNSVFKRETGIPMLKKDDPKGPPQSTKTAFVQRLSGTQMSQPFAVSEGYNNVKIWVSNKGKQRITISISKDSPTGELVSDRVVSIAGGTNWSFFRKTPWESGTYYINITSNGSPIKGMAVGRIGARLAELNL